MYSSWSLRWGLFAAGDAGLWWSCRLVNGGGCSSESSLAKIQDPLSTQIWSIWSSSKLLEPGLRTTWQLAKRRWFLPLILLGVPVWLYHLKYYAVPNTLSINTTLHGNLMFALQAPKFVGRGYEALQTLRFLFESPCDSQILCHNQIVWTIDWEQVHPPRDGRNHNQATFDLTRRACQWEGW